MISATSREAKGAVDPDNRAASPDAVQDAIQAATTRLVAQAIERRLRGIARSAETRRTVETRVWRGAVAVIVAFVAVLALIVFLGRRF